MKRLRSKLPLLALLVATLVVGGGGYLALVAPQRSHARQLDRSIDAEQAQVAALAAARATATTAGAGAIYALTRAMPTRDDMPGLLLELDHLAATAHVELVSVKPAPRVTLPDGSAALPVTVIVDGRYAGVTAFLRLLRTQVRERHGAVVARGRLFVADSVQVSLDAAAAKGPTSVSATVALNAFDFAAPPATTSRAGTDSVAPAPSSSAQAAGATP